MSARLSTGSIRPTSSACFALSTSESAIGSLLNVSLLQARVEHVWSDRRLPVTSAMQSPTTFLASSELSAM